MADCIRPTLADKTTLSALTEAAALTPGHDEVLGFFNLIGQLRCPRDSPLFL
jgi:hypothetical protein